MREVSILLSTTPLLSDVKQSTWMWGASTHVLEVTILLSVTPLRTGFEGGNIKNGLDAPPPPAPVVLLACYF